MGSDYTKGVYGIGPVNSIEIINSFPDKIEQNSEDAGNEIGEGLVRFK